MSSPHELRDALALDLRAIVRHARSGDYGDASSVMNVALQKLQHLLNAEEIDKQLVGTIAYSLETLYIMQQRHDWVAVADIVEYELIDLITSALDACTTPAT